MKRTDDRDVPCLHNQSYKMSLMIHVTGRLFYSSSKHGLENGDRRACTDFQLFKWSRNE